jgi:hypothetical protein
MRAGTPPTVFDMSDPFIAAASLEGVASAMAATRDGIDALLRDRGLRRTSPEDTARSLLLGAAATASIESGESIDPDELTVGGGSPTARAALRLSTELLSLVPVMRQAPVQAIARIHAFAAAGSVPDDELGRPAGPDGAARLGALARRLVQPTTAPALVVAALAHAEIATSGAFASHGGVVGRAVERLILVERGVDPASVTVPELGHEQDARSYRSALAAYSAGTEDQVGQWLRYASLAFARGAESSPIVSR